MLIKELIVKLRRYEDYSIKNFMSDMKVININMNLYQLISYLPIFLTLIFYNLMLNRAKNQSSWVKTEIDVELSSDVIRNIIAK